MQISPIFQKKMALFNEESIQFLDEVHKFDCLYNKFSKDFKNKFKKYNCWIKIGEKFGLSPEEAEKKFHYIRTAYGRHLRRMRSIPSGSGRSAVPKIDVNLEWLSTSITHRKTVSNFAVDEDQDEEVEAAGGTDAIVGLAEEEDTEMSPRDHAIDDEGITEAENQEKQSQLHDRAVEEDELNTLQETIDDDPDPEPLAEEQQSKIDRKKAITATKGKVPKKMNTSSESSQQRPWGVSKKEPSKQDVDFALIQTAKSVAEASNKFSPHNAKDGPEDENSLFCRSLVQRMQRLHPQMKAFVRCQIEQIFYQAEFGAQMPKGVPNMFGLHQFQQNQFTPADNSFQATAYSPQTTNFRYGSFLQQNRSSSSTPNSEETYTELGVPAGASNYGGQQYSQ